eukprot:411633-Prymnesium_polylepis.2
MASTTKASSVTREQRETRMEGAAAVGGAGAANSLAFFFVGVIFQVAAVDALCRLPEMSRASRTRPQDSRSRKRAFTATFHFVGFAWIFFILRKFIDTTGHAGRH